MNEPAEQEADRIIYSLVRMSARSVAAQRSARLLGAHTYAQRYTSAHRGR
jgi:hypothetical protein